MKKRILSSALFVVVLALAIACTQTPPTNQTARTTGDSTAVPAELKPAHDSINTADIMQHTKVLSGDEYEGRGPGTKGEELSVKYLTEQFQRLGLKPGNPDGTFMQKVPLAGMTSTTTASFTAGGKTMDLKFPARLCQRVSSLCAGIESREFGSGFRWLRRGRSRIWLGRLQGR